MNQPEKISIIIPVFNAEKFLGYCLNSLVSQSYTNWEAILINDGSTDSSLSICQNYSSIDSRIHVFSKENGGVSSARNYGLQFANGEYLEFLDSDDCLASDALEKQVRLAQKYQSSLIIMDVMMVNFSNPEQQKTLLSSAWLNQSPCCLTAEEFHGKLVRLIWFTSLLECLHGKLYSTELWKKLDLAFPDDLSYGEDFIANLKYYAACDRIVFLNECGHYYNCIPESDSLSHKYRDNLFEIKMKLLRAVESQLGGVDSLSGPELDAFFCYGANSGMPCIENMLLYSGKSQHEIILKLQDIMHDSLFFQCLQNASYIPDRYKTCRTYLLNGDFKEASQCSFANDEECCAAISCNPGILNRALRKCVRILTHFLPKKGRLRQRFLSLENEIYQSGLKVTIRNHLRNRTRVSKRYLIQNQAKIFDLQNHALASLSENIHALLQLQQQVIDTQKQILSEQEKSLTALQGKLCALQSENNAFIEKGEGLLWNTEVRITQDARMREINDLRQRKKAIMLATAEHRNIGDAAITLAEQQFLNQQFPDYYQIEISTYEFERKEEFLNAIVNPADILFLNGGGNIGDVYPAEELLHPTIIQQFPNNRIIIFPQTIFFKDLTGQIFLNSQRIYNGHKNLTLYLRGSESLRFAQQYFPNVKSFLMPDMVHMLHTEYTFERHGALLCLRDDEEARITAQQRDDLSARVKAVIPEVTYTTNMNTVDITRDIRGLVVRHELMRFAKHQVVITDRLHGMIFSVVTNTPCVVLSSYNQKIPEYYNTFLKDSNLVFFLGNDLSKLENTVEKASHLNVTANTLSQLSNFMWEV